MELKSSPFCGGEARLAVRNFPAGDRYRIECTDCGASSWSRIADGKKAIKRWNTRKGQL